MSYIVKRTAPRDAMYRSGFTGPMRTKTHAQREADAWINVGWSAEVVEYTAEVKAEVRAWQKAKADNASR